MHNNGTTETIKLNREATHPATEAKAPGTLYRMAK